MQEIKTLEDTDRKVLDKRVNQFLEAGWELYGEAQVRTEYQTRYRPGSVFVARSRRTVPVTKHVQQVVRK